MPLVEPEMKAFLSVSFRFISNRWFWIDRKNYGGWFHGFRQSCRLSCIGGPKRRHLTFDNPYGNIPTARQRPQYRHTGDRFPLVIYFVRLAHRIRAVSAAIQ